MKLAGYQLTDRENMRFINDRTVYERGNVRVYINQCYARGRKTKIYAIRRDDTYSVSCLLGMIQFDGAWRQYVFEPDKNTKWCSSCLKEIDKFIDEINLKWRRKHG